MEVQFFYNTSDSRVINKNLITGEIFTGQARDEVDVLMSFRSDILRLAVVVDKQSMNSNGNEYIDDSSLVAENVMFQTVYNFQSGFNSTGEYILITAG